MQYTAEQIQKSYDKASQEVQDLLSSADTSDKLVTIGETHGLSLEQIEDLIDEFGLTALGFTIPNWFEQNLTERLLIPADQGRAIAKDVREELLSKISLGTPAPSTQSTNWYTQAWIVTDGDKTLTKRIRDSLRKNPSLKLRDFVATGNKTGATDEAGKIIQERFAILPREIAQAITSPHLEGNVEFIRNKNSLLIDKATAIQNETLLLVMDFIDPKEFLVSLSTTLSIPPTEANLIARDIYQRIIQPIINSLIAFGRIREADSAKIVTPTKIESVSMRGPDVVVQTSTRIALDDITGAGIPAAGGVKATMPVSASKDTHEFIPTLAQKPIPQTFPAASFAPQKIGTWPARPQSAPEPGNPSVSSVPPSKPISASAMVMPKTPEAVAAMKPYVSANITTEATKPAETTLAPKPSTNDQQPTTVTPKIPEVSSALAAEISNLLKKSGTAPGIAPQTNSTRNQQSITDKITSIAQTPTATLKPLSTPTQSPVVPQSVAPSASKSPTLVESTSINTPQNSSGIPSYATPIKTMPSATNNGLPTQNIRPAAPATPLAPADKLAGMMQKPRTEVMMTKKAPEGGGGDPYREPVA